VSGDPITSKFRLYAGPRTLPALSAYDAGSPGLGYRKGEVSPLN
jgi:hypothetical protein